MHIQTQEMSILSAHRHANQKKTTYLLPGNQIKPHTLQQDLLPTQQSNIFFFWQPSMQDS